MAATGAAGERMSDAAGLAEGGYASAARTIRRVTPYLWPEGERAVRTRVVLAMLALVAAKFATVVTPFFFKSAVDGLAPADPAYPKPLVFLALILITLGK